MRFPALLFLDEYLSMLAIKRANLFDRTRNFDGCLHHRGLILPPKNREAVSVFCVVYLPSIPSTGARIGSTDKVSARHTCRRTLFSATLSQCLTSFVAVQSVVQSPLPFSPPKTTPLGTPPFFIVNLVRRGDTLRGVFTQKGSFVLFPFLP